MPKLYEYCGIVFLFYSDEHLPIHVHAQYQEFQNKFEFIYDDGVFVGLKIKKVRGFKELPLVQLSDAKIFCTVYQKQILEKWNDFFILKKKIKSEKITKKIKGV